MKRIFFALVLISAVYEKSSAQQAKPAVGLEVGNLAPELKYKAPDGKEIALSSLRGNIVLIDFWASWCGPCRYTNKELVKLYSKYKEKGFEIFGVSLDVNHKDWAKAIAKDKISWLQVVDDRGWDAKTAISWRINAIPTNYLIDKEGKLIAMDLEPKDLEKQLKDMLNE